MANKYDGTLPFGSRVLTIGGVTYIADNVDVTRPSKVVRNTDENDEPDGAVYVPDFVTGSATLQLASSATAIPALHAEFTTTMSSGVGVETFILTEIGQPETKDGLKKVRVSFAKKYN